MAMIPPIFIQSALKKIFRYLLKNNNYLNFYFLKNMIMFMLKIMTYIGWKELIGKIKITLYIKKLKKSQYIYIYY